MVKSFILVTILPYSKYLKISHPLETVLLKFLMGNLLCEDSRSAGLRQALGDYFPNKFPDDADAAGLWIIL